MAAVQQVARTCQSRLLKTPRCTPCPARALTRSAPGADDDALGIGLIPVTYSGEKFTIEKAVMKGQAQEGTAGYFFPDFEVSFDLEFKGIFAH